jgi:hypothetical protein
MVDPWYDDVAKRWAIGCGRCGASSGRSVHAEGSKEAAIKSWNTRAPAQASGEPVAYRYRRKEWSGIWRYYSTLIRPEDFETPSEWIIEPLYAAPPQLTPDSPVNELLKALEDAARATQPQQAIGPGNPVFEETRAAVTAAREKLLAEYKAENERLRAPPQTAWHTAESAPKDGKTFVAISYHRSFEDSVSWVAYWNGEHFEPTNAGDQIIDGCFTHWMIPDASSLSRPVHTPQDSGS